MPTAIDLFAGAGGFTEGAEQAGLRVLWAANHWPLAIEYHGRNHPSVDHACQDLQQADFRQAPAHDFLLASPSCTGHTPARGKDRPSHDAARATAWAVVTAAEVHRPPVVVVENVPAFQKWILFPAWAQAMGALGYSMAPVVIDAADLGVPQHRVRLFLVGVRGRFPLPVQLPRMAHTPFRAVMEDGHGWSEIEKPGRAAATLRRIRAGRQEFGSEFLIPYYGSEEGGRSLDRPLGTVTTRDRWALIRGEKMRMIQPSEYRAAMGFPSTYELPAQRAQAVHLLGNAVCPPVARELLAAVLNTL